MAAGDEASAKRIAQNYVRINQGINAKYADKSPSARVASARSMPDFSLRDIDLVKKQIEAQARLDDEMKRGKDSVAAYKASLADMLETRQEQIKLQAESVGMSQKEIAQQQALIAIDQDYNRKKATLIRQQQDTTSALQKGWYQEQLDALAKYHDDRVAAEVDGWSRQQDAESNGLLGMRAAMKDFIDEQSNMA
jgi:lambda family phage tail tape measure protein